MQTIDRVFLLLILCLALSCSGPSVAQSSGPEVKTYITPEEALPQLQQLFRREAHYQRLSGTVLIRHRESIIYQAAFGKTSRGIVAGQHTRFDIGSISKSFTAAAILHLAKEGQLNLQDPINDHLGQHRSDQWKKVTIHQLLTHTSGIPSIYQTEQGLPLFYPQETPILLDSLISRFQAGKLLFKPGSSFSYSNSGYVLLAVIVSQVSGLSFDAYLERHIFRPYGLEHTSFQTGPQAAQPYYGYRETLSRPAPRHHWSWAIGAGGIYTNAADLSQWLDLIQSDHFLSAEWRASYLQSHTSAGYGYGWQFTREGKIQHDGGAAGFVSFASFDPYSGHQIVLLTNRSFEDTRQFSFSSQYVRSLADKAWDILAGKETEILPAPGHMPALEGNYQFDQGIELSFTPESNASAWVHTTGVMASRIMADTPLASATKKERMMNDLADLLHRKKHWGVAKYCNGEMKFVSYTGLLSIGMKMIRKKTGQVQSAVAYYVNADYGLIRLKGDQQSVDIQVYFDSTGKIQGLADRRYFSPKGEIPLLAHATADGRFFLDGFDLGEPDAFLELTGNSLRLTQSGRTIEAKRIE